MAQAQTAIRACKDPWWVNPYRLAGAGFFAISVSALAAVSSAKPDKYSNLLLRDAASVISLPAKRPEQWGSLMRREPKDAVVPTHSHEQPVSVIPLPSQERPTQWGHMMRREAKTVVPPAASQQGTVVPTLSRKQPAHWGHMMRREPKIAPPPVTVAADAIGSMNSSVRPSTFLALLAAMVALVAFAQQMRTSMLALFPDQSKGKFN
eukprot:TRINITY_DN2443_c0_g1_i4.p1 TRINITY_DN2443_c0_g1~~TRINITY_DN2443_c0_g1_i4.p1  ORF type:complete len:207 (+),score=35.90 TRINITY_DN2443_c0_g1_i4:75-695(+)